MTSCFTSSGLSNPKELLAKTIKDSPNEPLLRIYQRWKNAICEEALRKSDQMHQTFEKSSLAMTHKLDDMIELPKSQPKRTYKEDLECEMVMVKMPRCMSWLDSTDAYDEPIGSLGMMNNEVGNTSPQITLQVLPSIEVYTPLVTYPKEVDETLGTPMKEKPLDQAKLEDVGDERGPEPPIKTHSPDSFRKKVIEDDFLEEELSLPMEPKELENENSVVFIARTGKRLLWAVPAVPYISEGQSAYEWATPRNKAKIEKENDVLETMNIELEHSVATLRKENETLKQHYKDLYDSIKITRSKTTEQTTSLLANNAELKAHIQESFAIGCLKNDFKEVKEIV
ncbi:hypothetical protein Tco_0001190 [Tanacetum coccineum]